MHYLKLKSYAKINLGLNIYPRVGSNPKHPLASIMMLIDDYVDEIELCEWTQPTLIEYYYHEQKLTITHDTCQQLINFLESKGLHQHFHIIIHKHIPMYAGLGGSSSNAGTIGRYLIQHYQLSLSAQDFYQIATDIGSDIPFFMTGWKLALVQGVGEQLTNLESLPLPQIRLLPLAWEVSTQAVFEQFDTLPAPLTQNDYTYIVQHWDQLPTLSLSNDLYPACQQLSKTWAEATQALKNHHQENLLLTGSGSFWYYIVTKN